ncbi:MAG: hypothetical protein Q4P71_03445 [Actinomycetaceae bacterium]|nr:hypothetical protein [Actinomycetaceae bacterium]
MYDKPKWLRGNLPLARQENPKEQQSILFFCTANICRSPFAEQLLAHYLSQTTSITVDSAGIYALTGHGMDPLMLKELQLRNVTVRPHHAKQLTGRLIESASLLITFEQHHLQWLLTENPRARRKTLILGQLERLLREAPAPRTLDEIVMDASGLPILDSDVLDDPFSRGTEQIRLAAGRIERTLELLRETLQNN